LQSEGSRTWRRILIDTEAGPDEARTDEQEAHVQIL
jgi:hypothetical protein